MVKQRDQVFLFMPQQGNYREKRLSLKGNSTENVTSIFIIIHKDRKKYELKKTEVKSFPRTKVMAVFVFPWWLFTTFWKSLNFPYIIHINVKKQNY